MSEPEGTQVIVGNFEVTMNLTDKRGVKLLGYITAADDAKSINRKLDLYQDALDRQFVRADLVTKRAEIKRWEATIDSLSDQYDAMTTKQQGGIKISSQEKQQMGKHETDLRLCRKNIESLEAAIAEANKQLAT